MFRRQKDDPLENCSQLELNVLQLHALIEVTLRPEDNLSIVGLESSTNYGRDVITADLAVVALTAHPAQSTAAIILPTRADAVMV